MTLATGAGLPVRHLAKGDKPMPTITPSLWFDDDMAEAVKFYTALFPNSSIEHVDPEMRFMQFVLDGTRFTAINGGAQFPFTEAVSFQIDCGDQDEVDYYWNALLDGGQESQCGWLKDRYGLSWQVIPNRLFELLADPDPARAAAAQKAMLDMRKIVIADLEAAAANP